MNRPDEIEDSVSLLGQSESALDERQRARLFREGIEGLNDHLEFNPLSEHAAYVANRKRAHTRALLTHLGDGSRLDFPEMIEYCVFVIPLVRAEVADVCRENPELAEGYKCLETRFRRQLRAGLEADGYLTRDGRPTWKMERLLRPGHLRGVDQPVPPPASGQ